MSAMKGPSAIAAAAFLLLAYFGFTVFVAVQSSDAGTEHWSRLITLFSSLEALGFAAAGLLLGQSIERPHREAMAALSATNTTLRLRDQAMKRAVERIRSDMAEVKDMLQSTEAAGQNDHEVQIRRAESLVERALVRVETLSESGIDTPGSTGNK